MIRAKRIDNTAHEIAHALKQTPLEIAYLRFFYIKTDKIRIALFSEFGNPFSNIGKMNNAKSLT